ncbi:AsnC family transcriptional regulator [Candidatus Woesearchaeota archaeon]|nr:AsnC family transcriptional regulator [Candidatus Woesearchaeota archaeon]
MIDDIDIKIIERLSENGRLSLTNLSSGMELSRVAIANRIEKLLQNGLLHVGVSVNLEKLNYQTLIVELQVPKNKSIKFKKLLNQSPQIQHCFEVTGQYNWMLVCSDKSSKNLRQFIETTLKQLSDDCRVTMASNPCGPEFAHHKSAKVCKSCEVKKDGV